ncbi:MAG: glycosyltransferase [Saprospiraceae bacterium]|nr:glycosyltransferase [Saprospiraceae bacterium]
MIVAFKNEEKKVGKTIAALLQQNYEAFEIIAIDDFSTDGSFNTLSTITDPRLKLIKATEDRPGKKAALTEAIEVSKYELLLFTDADCTPVSNYWIESMVGVMLSKTQYEIVIGYGPMQKTSGLLNDFVRYETILTAIQYVTYALSGLPYMGVGRNMMIKKSLFKSVNGYKTHQHIPSGDDDLLIRSAATSRNTAVNISSESFVYSAAKTNLTDYVNQKTRHITSAMHYKGIHKVLLGLFALSQTGFYLLWLTCLICDIISIPVILGMLIFKWIIQLCCHHASIKRLDGTDLWWKFPVLDAIMTLYLFVVAFMSFFRKKSW